MEGLLNYLLTVILRDAKDVQALDKNSCCGEDSFIVISDNVFVFTKSEIRKIRSLFAARWRYICDTERQMIYESLRKMK